MSDYEQLIIGICRRINEAVPVPPRRVNFLSGEEPAANKCHENVNRWIGENPQNTPVRGWLVSGLVLDAHSALAEPDGILFDITPLPMPGLLFLRHLGTEAEFWFIVGRTSQIHCVSCL
jgi:hypothetical protein